MPRMSSTTSQRIDKEELKRRIDKEGLKRRIDKESFSTIREKSLGGVPNLMAHPLLYKIDSEYSDNSEYSDKYLLF